MGPARQNPILRTVRNCSSKCAYDCTTLVHNTAQNRSDNLPSYFQTSSKPPASLRINLKASTLLFSTPGDLYQGHGGKSSGTECTVDLTTKPPGQLHNTLYNTTRTTNTARDKIQTKRTSSRVNMLSPSAMNTDRLLLCIVQHASSRRTKLTFDGNWLKTMGSRVKPGPQKSPLFQPDNRLILTLTLSEK